ncbi:MAG TPA: hypothetical protein VGM06_07520 [Polyangiaceae bacterium]|jgi:hypothetical protein
MKTHAFLAIAAVAAWASPSFAADPAPGTPAPVPAAKPTSTPPAPLPLPAAPAAAKAPSAGSPLEDSGVVVEPAPSPRAPAYGVWTPAATPARTGREDAPPRDASMAVSHEAPLQAMWRVEAGFRANFVTDPGYNPFSTKDYFGQFALAASRTVFVAGPFSFAPGLSWDYGRSSATARGDGSSLDVHRLLVPLEGRVQFGRWGYALVRVAPGVAVEDAEVDDPASPTPLTKSRWLFAGDLSAGYAFPIVAHTGASASSPGFWVQADGGYGFVATQRLELTQNGSSATASADLGDLALRGGFFRISVAVGF